MIYCIADIHGDYARYQKMLQTIEFSEADTLYIIGDVIDRGPDGVKILLDIMERENVQMILGNHEYMCLSAFDPLYDSYAFRLWMDNGGKKTYKDLKYKRTDEQRTRILRYLRSLPYHMDIEVNGRTFYLVHGCPVGDLFESLWSRPKPNAPAPFEEKTVIVGHTPTYLLPTPDSEENGATIWRGNGVIDIDCGCGYGLDCSRLACLRLDDMKEFYV